MLAKDFFRAIVSGAHIGVIKFRNGEEALITSDDIILNISGDKFIIKIPQSDVRLEYNEDWKVLTQIPNAEDWSAIAAYFDDMLYHVARVAAGAINGYFYNAKGEKIRATKTTVKLLPNYNTTRRFTVLGPNNLEMHYFVDILTDTCKHGQLAAFNIIDFIED